MFSSDIELVATDDFALAGTVELDLSARRALRFTLPTGDLARSVRLRIGRRKGSGDRKPVFFSSTAYFGAHPVAASTVQVRAGGVGELVLESDAITAVEVGSGDAALIDLCVELVKDRATASWKPVPRCPQPLSLPARDPDYPSDSRPQDAAADEATALSRVHYGSPATRAGSPFSELHDLLLELVDGGPAAGAMANRATTNVPGVATTGETNLPRMPQLRPLDLVLLGSLAPEVAQMVGLYWIDQSAQVGSTYDYLLVADHTGAGGGSANSVLQELQTNGFTNLDGWIHFAMTLGPSSPLEAPTEVHSYALPGLTIDSGIGPVDGPNNAGVTWPVATNALPPDETILFHVWRTALGNATTPGTPTAGPQALTKDAPVLPAVASTPAPSTPEADWPPFPLRYVDRALAEGWYAYSVSGVDIYGRHSAPSAPGAWRQWAPEPVPRPWYYQSPAADLQIHPSAVRLLDKIAPPKPTAVEAYALDPLDPLVVKDAAYQSWWSTLSQTEQTTIVGLRVRWRWTAAHIAHAPDTAEFRVYVNPGSTPPADHDHASSWSERAYIVAYADHVSMDGTDRVYEIFLPLAGDSVRNGIDLPVPVSDPVAYANVSVTACDSRPHSPDDTKWAGTRWGDRAGNEGPVGPAAVVYRVRRTLPDAPAVPAGDEIVYATPADYHGRSYYTFRWTPGAHLKTHVYRALDDSVFAADWDYRFRKGQRAPIAAADITLFPSETIEPRWDSAKRAQVAIELNALQSLSVAADMPAAARAIYESLTSDALRVLAGLEGTDAAFSQQTIKPLDPDPLIDPSTANRAGPDNPKNFPVDSGLRIYIDTLDGASTNRYLYRAAHVDAANNQSALSASSPPVWLPNVVRPRTPSLTRTEAGDRKISLYWASNREPDLASYLAFRTDNEDDASNIATMTRVHTEVVPAGAPSSRPMEVSWTDDPVQGRIPLYYRLVAVDTEGNRSSPTDALTLRAFDDYHPAHPDWSAPAAGPNPDELVLSWTSPLPNLTCVVQRRVSGLGPWESKSGWLPRGAYSFTDDDRTSGLQYDYRLRVMDQQGLTNNTYALVTN